MLPKYDINKLDDAMYDFNRATGISISLYNTEGQVVTKKGTSIGGYCRLITSVKEGQRSCSRSNRILFEKCKATKKTARHICGAGLVDITIPLLHRDEIVGYLMLGQLKLNEQLPEDTLLRFPIDREELENRYNALPLYNDQMIESIINIATMLTKYIMLENMVRSQQNQSAMAVADYVDDHLSDKLTVDSVARGVHLSPSGIYKCMRQSYNCTLGEYICARRIERAAKLLEDADISIEEVADAVGFSDAAYFSRCFKKIMGVSPREYRKRLE
ncbi:MAG: helix-turn-helix domain-containing protein [Ruminococcaceae bacterium]|nr:helix-turn-helix domain-containing protein [Oscillospiraceae bacterium]